MSLYSLGLAIELITAIQLRKLSTLYSSVQEVMTEVKLSGSGSPGSRAVEADPAAAISGRSSNSPTPPAMSPARAAADTVEDQWLSGDRSPVEAHLNASDVPGSSASFHSLAIPAAEEGEPVESMDNHFRLPPADIAMLEAMDSLLGETLPRQSTNLDNPLEPSLESASPDAEESPSIHDITRTDRRLMSANSQLFPYWAEAWQTSAYNQCGAGVGDFGDPTYGRRIQTAPQNWQAPTTGHRATTVDGHHTFPANLTFPSPWNSQIINPQIHDLPHLRTPVFPSNPLPSDRKLVAFIYRERSARLDGSASPLPQPDPSEFFWETPVNPICAAVKDYIAPIRSTMQLPEIFASFWAITLMVTVSDTFHSCQSLPLTVR